MSEGNPDNLPAAPAKAEAGAVVEQTAAKESSAPEATDGGKKKRPRRWRRRLKIAIIFLFLLVPTLRIALQFLLPTVIRHTAAAYGLSATFERHETNLFGGDFGLWHLVLAPIEGGPALFAADYCRGDLSPWDLLRGRLVILRLEAEGVDVRIDRDAKGEIELFKRLGAHGDGGATPSTGGKPASVAASPTARTPSTPAVAPPPKELNFTSPLQLSAFRMDRVRAHIRDQSISPPYAGTVEFNLRVTDLRSPVRPTGFDLDFSARPLVDSIRAKGQGHAAGKELDANMQVVVSGVHPGPAAGYLKALGIKPVARDLSMTASGHVTTSAATQPTALAARIRLDQISVTADGDEVAGLDRLDLQARSVSATAADVASIVIDGGRMTAGRSSEGAMRIAGVELLPASNVAAVPVLSSAAAPESTKAPAPQPQAGIQTVSQPATPPYLWSIARIDVSNVRADFADQFIRPDANLACSIESLTLKELTNDPAAGATGLIAISAKLSAPNIAKSIQVDGGASLRNQAQTANLSVRMAGIKPDALRPYINAAGAECLMSDATLTCSVLASMAAGKIDAQLKDFQITDGAELFALQDVQVKGLRLGDEGEPIRVASIELHGPALDARRDASGNFRALGFRTKPVQPGGAVRNSAMASASAEAVGGALPPASGPAMLPKMEIDRLSWTGLRVRYEDQKVTPATTLAMDDAGLEVVNLRLGYDPKLPPPEPAQINAWVKIPGVAGGLKLKGNVTPRRENSTTIDLDISGEGLSASPVRAYIDTRGFEPVLKDGVLHAHFGAELKQNPDGSVASVSSVKLSDVEFKDASGELGSVSVLSVSGINLSASANEVERISIDRPRIRISKEKDGTFTLAGIHTLAATPAAAPPPVVATAGTPSDRALPARPTTAPASAPASAPAGVASLIKALEVNDATIDWTDNSLATPLKQSATVSTSIGHLTYGGRAEAATVSVTGKVDGAIDKFSIAGRVVPSDTAPDAQLQISASGVRAGALVAYMPPTIRPTLKDGSLKMTLDAGMSPHAKGGVKGRVIVTGLNYRDASEGMPLLRLDSATVKCDRYDPESKVIALEEISLSGLEADVRTAAEGLRLLGIETVAAAAAAAAPVAAAPAAAAVKPQQAAAMPVAVAAPAEKAAPTTQDVARAVAANRLDLPLITLAKLNVGVQRLRVTDMTRPSAAPIAVEDFTLTGQRLEMLGNDSENRPPMDLAIDCRPAPIADSLKARLKLAPFAQRPSVHVNLTAAGIQGDRLLSAFPELKPKIDASKLTDGQLSAELKAEVKMDHRDLLRRDFSRPFEADVSLKGLGLHNGDGTALASVEEFRSDGVHVEPRTGAVRAKSLEISNLAAAIMRDADGLHALGLVFRTPTTQPAGAQTASAVAPPVAESVQPAAVAKATPTTAPTSTPTRPDAEQRIDALIVSGMNVSFEDHTVDPPLRIPITALELEARDLSNYLMYDADKSMRFSLLVNSGKVPLPRGSKKGSPPAAPTTQPIVAMDDRHDAAAAAPAGGPTTQSVAMDERELFAQLTASGKLSLYPAPKGWVKTSLSGLELGALKGEARQAGFDLSGGTFDANIDTRFLDSGTLDMHPKFVFVDLSIAEPTKGPVERYFSLPVSLDGAVNVLEDASGQITVPLHVVVEQGKVNSSDVTASVVGAVTGIVVTAIANAPLKAGMGVASLVGIQFNTKRPPPGPVTLAFDASATGLGQSERDLPKALVERLIKEPTLDITLKHDLSSVDVDLAGQRVNPRGDDAMAVSYSLRQNKMALLKERAQVAGRARGELGSGVNADATLLRLRNIEQELAVIEDSLDDLNELLRPGAGRQALRRTRAACIAIGEQRLISVRDLLMASGIPNINERIHVTHAKFNPDDTIDHGRVMMTFAPRAKQ